MDSLQAYGSSSSDDESNGNEEISKGKSDETGGDPSFRPVAKVQRADRRYLNPAPSVSLGTKMLIQQQKAEQSSGADGQGSGIKRKREDRIVMLSNNPKKDVLYEPVQGPMNDAGAETQRRLSRYQPQVMQANLALDEAAFQEQRVEFQKSGRAMPLVTDTSVHDENPGAANNGELLRTTLGYDKQRLQKFAKQQETRKTMVQKAFQKDKKEKDPLVLGSDDEVEYGVWGPPTKQEVWQKQNNLTHAETGDLAPEQVAEREYIQERNRVRGQEEEDRPVMTLDRILERKMAHLLPPQQGADSKPLEASSEFHGNSEYDYQGRSWLAPPAGMASAASAVDHDNFKCFVPKKCVARFGNNKNGFHRIRLFPTTGHLLLSAGLDGVCQVWSLNDGSESKKQQPKLMRSYKGHSAACRDVQFNLTGTQFVSASFDRYLRLWDTQSGDVLQTFTNGKVPYCIQFYPKDDSYFVVGCSDNRIVTYHTETGELTQEYNHHLAPVNAIVFVTYGEDNNEPVKMVTSSDDKKILVWEWDIGVPIKYISDPTMHSMPCLSMHPSGQFICGQSLDNTICCIQTSPKIRVSHSKKFSGHMVSGYACEVAFSPDGKYIVSGDGSGALFVWDWKRHKILQKFRAHDKATMGVVWHPFEKSTLFTCSWDGVIKMWQ